MLKLAIGLVDDGAATRVMPTVVVKLSSRDVTTCFVAVTRAGVCERALDVSEVAAQFNIGGRPI